MSEDKVLTGDLKGVVLKEKEVSRRIDALGLEEDTSMALKDKFLPFVIEAEKWRAQADAIVITQEGDKNNMKLARETRLALKGIRVNLEKERKALKKESLARGQAIDLIAGTLRTLIEPIEEDLDIKERFDEIRAEERKEELWKKRTDELAIYKLEQYPFDLREASEEQYKELVDMLEAARLKKIADDAEFERLRLLEVAAQAEITRKKELAAARSKEMLQKGFQHDGMDLGEVPDNVYAELLVRKQAEADEKKMLQDLKDLGEQSVQVIAHSINIATLETVESIEQAIELFQLAREEKLAEFYSGKAEYLKHLLETKTGKLLEEKEKDRLAALRKDIETHFKTLEDKVSDYTLEIISSYTFFEETPVEYKDVHYYYQEKNSSLKRLISSKKTELENIAKLEKEKEELTVQNVELQQQVPEIKIEEKAPQTKTSKIVGAIGKTTQALSAAVEIAKQTPVAPAGPTADQINSDKVTLVALAGIIASIQMPEVETMAAKNILAGTGQLIEKIRVYLVEKAKTLK